MTISDDLFRAILAMDAYNRGDSPGIIGLGGVTTQIGNATISRQSDTTAGSPEMNASFSATAYTWNNHQIISYRGTDSLGIDLLTGGLAAIGAPGLSQPKLAAQFYQSVINNPTVSPYNSTVEFTGHSLGGGLAGFVGALYGQSATVFDNINFFECVARTNKTKKRRASIALPSALGQSVLRRASNSGARSMRRITPRTSDRRARLMRPTGPTHLCPRRVSISIHCPTIVFLRASDAA